MPMVVPFDIVIVLPLASIEVLTGFLVVDGVVEGEVMGALVDVVDGPVKAPVDAVVDTTDADAVEDNAVELALLLTDAVFVVPDGQTVVVVGTLESTVVVVVAVVVTVAVYEVTVASGGVEVEVTVVVVIVVRDDAGPAKVMSGGP